MTAQYYFFRVREIIPTFAHNAKDARRQMQDAGFPDAKLITSLPTQQRLLKIMARDCSGAEFDDDNGFVDRHYGTDGKFHTIDDGE